MRRYEKWMRKDEVKKKLKNALEKAGVPLELRANKFLEDHGYTCATYHYKDPDSGKYRELEIYASKTNVHSFNIEQCEVVFNIVILAECKYSRDTDFLAFESKKNHFPTFPVLFSGEHILSTPYLNFKFPMVIRKIAETNMKGLESSENFQDRRTHKACQQLTSCFSYIYEKRTQKHKIMLGQYQIFFDKLWKDFLSQESTFIGDKLVLQQKIGDFLKQNYGAEGLLRRIPYFSIEIGFPLLIIHEDMGLIRIRHNIANGKIEGFEDVGYGIYPYVSEHADRYDNILHGYYAFPILICNLAYLDDLWKTLDSGIRKLVDSAKKVIHNNPYRVPEEVLERLYAGNLALRQ